MLLCHDGANHICASIQHEKSTEGVSQLILTTRNAKEGITSTEGLQPVEWQNFCRLRLTCTPDGTAYVSSNTLGLV